MSLVVINSEIIQKTYFDKIKLDFGSLLKEMNDEEFLKFSRENDDLLIEMNAKGDLEIVPGTGGLTGKKNFVFEQETRKLG